MVRNCLSQDIGMSEKFNLYLGRAGQLAVMSEFLTRGWNVAIPEVDIDDDIFIFKNNQLNHILVTGKNGLR